MSRNIRLPQAFSMAATQGYFMVTKQDAATVIFHKLTGTQLRLWLYLMMLDSFADYDADGERIYHPLPSPNEMALQLGISVGRVEKEMRVLRKLGLYDYRITAWQGHNLVAARARLESERLKQHRVPHPDPPPHSQQGSLNDGQNSPFRGQNSPPSSPPDLPDGQNSPRNGQNSPLKRLNSPRESAESPDFNRVPESPQTIQTIQTLSDPPEPNLNERERQKNWQTDPKFRNWLRERAKCLPKPPQFLEVWIDAQTHKESFQREYQANQSLFEGTDLPPPPPDYFQIETACLAAMEQNDRDYVLMRLRALWQQGWHDLVEDLVQSYPKWGLMLTCSGVEEAEDG